MSLGRAFANEEEARSVSIRSFTLSGSERERERAKVSGDQTRIWEICCLEGLAAKLKRTLFIRARKKMYLREMFLERTETPNRDG